MEKSNGGKNVLVFLLILSSNLFASDSEEIEDTYFKILDEHFAYEPAAKIVDLDLEPDIDALIFDGLPVENPKDWMSVLPIEAEAQFCTLTVVGPKVLLTAAHCIKEKSTIVGHINQQKVLIYCLRHPEYERRESGFDIAVCASNKPAVDLDNVPIEVISFESSHSEVEKNIAFLGYGCTDANGIKDTKRLYMGTGAVSESKEEYIDVKGDSFLCYGDSGGGSFRIEDEHTRFIIGVNSQSDFAGISRITPLSSLATKKFISRFSSINNLPVCGIGEEIEYCRH